MVSHTPTKFGGHRDRGSGEILQDNATKGYSNMGWSP